MTEMVYLNGEFIDSNEAKVPINDSGFLYGFGCYETLRGYQGRTFRLDMHLERLSQTAKLLKLPVEIEALGKIIPEILKRNRFENSRVRITLTGGEINPLSKEQMVNKPNLLVTGIEYHPYSAGVYEKGFQVILAQSTRNSRSSLTEMKTTCFLESLLARRQAIEAGADDALLVNEKGLLAEASSSNVFILKDRILKTPRSGSGLLPGVTRRILFELAIQEGIEVIETDIQLNGLKAGDEVFLTNSMIEIMPVTQIDGAVIGDGKPGKATQKLRAAFRDMVRRGIS
jgi:branched-chain amino acid aminotransferase